MDSLDNNSVRHSETLVVPQEKALWKRYYWMSVCFTIAGALPLLISLGQIATATNSSDSHGALGLGILIFWYSAIWFSITLPFSFLMGVAALSFGGYSSKLTKGEQPFKQRTQVMMVIACLDILGPIAVFLFYILPLLMAVKGN